MNAPSRAEFSPPNVEAAHHEIQTRLKAAMSEVFGIERLRPGQEEVIRNVLRGADTLAVMPTGAGKSLCYQLPALELGGLTLVVSPLISLMKDQSDKLVAAGVGATVLNSSLSASEEKEVFENLDRADTRVLFVTPERLASDGFASILSGSGKPPISLAVIDEAHCISRWGHDFRPAFVEMQHALRQLGRPPILALTATATPAVIVDILQELDMTDASVINTGVYRDNLQFAVEQFTNPAEKRTRLVNLATQLDGTGIVYCATVAECEAVHRALLDASVDARIYHGKLSTTNRNGAQDAFMTGQCRVIVATNAFGMGIDKPDIRFVIHDQMPGSLEAYYQEAGRAGRDGADARCVLLFEMKDRHVQQFFLSGRYPSAESVSRIVETMQRIGREKIGKPLRELVKQLHELLPDIGMNRLRIALNLMQDVGILKNSRHSGVSLKSLDQRDGLEEAQLRIQTRTKNDRDVLEKMVGYAQSAKCRWRLILDYFDAHLAGVDALQPPATAERQRRGIVAKFDGDELDGGVCCRCDNCLSPLQIRESPREVQQRGSSSVSSAESPSLFELRDKVRVRRHGAGVVAMVSGERVAVEFPDGDCRTFIARYLKPVRR